MSPEAWIPLSLSLVTAAIVAGRRVFSDFAQVIRLLTQLREDTKICLVGIEALRMIDTDTDARLRLLSTRLDDLERYMQLATQASKRPYVIRSRDRD